MLGGLARWLRAAGYDSRFEYGIDDGELVARARAEGHVILSCDGPMFERNVIKNGEVRALRVPRQLDNVGALRFVLEAMKLPLRTPRCMACGGELVEVPKHTVIEEAPPPAHGDSIPPPRQTAHGSSGKRHSSQGCPHPSGPPPPRDGRTPPPH
jgi:uncharacterized protein with PIN domain